MRSYELLISAVHANLLKEGHWTMWSAKTLGLNGMPIRGGASLGDRPSLIEGLDGGEVLTVIKDPSILNAALNKLKADIIKDTEQRKLQALEEIKDNYDNPLGVPGQDFWPVQDYRVAARRDDSIFMANSEGIINLGYAAYCSQVNQAFPKKDQKPDGIIDPKTVAIEFEPFAEGSYLADKAITHQEEDQETLVLNVWRPPTWWKEKDSFEPVIRPWIKKFFDHLVDSNPEELQVLLFLLYKMVRGERLETIVVFAGVGGIGKTILGEFATQLLGDENVAITDAKTLKRENTNKDITRKSLVIYEEQGVDSDCMNLLKQMTNSKVSSREMRKDREKINQIAQSWVLFNQDTGFFESSPMERRPYVFKLTETTLEERFGVQSSTIEQLKNGEGVGELYAYLTQVYTAQHPIKQLDQHAVGVKTPEFYRLVLKSLEINKRGFLAFLEMLEHNFGVDFMLSEVTYYRGSTKTEMNQSQAMDFIQGWTEAGIVPAKLFRDPGGRMMVKSLIQDREQLVHCQDKHYKYEPVAPAFAEDNLLRDMLEDI